MTLADQFRAVMRDVCTPVSVVTALDDAGPHGTTVSSFASLSLEPPMVLLGLDRGSATLEVVARTGRFGLNVLAAGQDDLARAFAGKGDDKFAGVEWALDRGLPRLPGASGWLACEVDALSPGGDHLVVTGRVLAAGQARSPRSPLTYHRRTFGTHARL